MGALDPITGAEDLISSIGGDLIKHFFPDPAQQAKAKEQFAELRQNGALAEMMADTKLKLAQIQVDDDEAKKGGWFGDWRDGIGWTCTLSFFWMYVGLPFAEFWLSVFGLTVPALPNLDMTTPQKILLALLGLGGGGLKLIERRMKK